MAIHFKTHRFGPDEDAVGRLINSDLPEDDEERWNMLSAPAYRIQKLLAEHQQAQARLRECLDSGKPFVLFLRSFSSEQRSERIGGVFSSWSTPHSYEFLSSLTLELSEQEVPIVRLHGGSDALFPDVGDQGNILSTHAENWEAVARELIVAAAAIVLLIGELSRGVLREVELIREQARVEQTLVRLADPRDIPGPATSDVEALRASLKDFRDIDGQALAELLRGAHTRASLDQALNAEFSYLEPEFVQSEDFAATERHIWASMLRLRVLFEDTYWGALKHYGVAFDHFDFPGAWVGAHRVYGLALVTADFQAIAEALGYLHLLYVFRHADFALVIPSLVNQFQELGGQIFHDGPPDTEARFAPHPDPLKLPATSAVALNLCQSAEDAARSGDAGTASYFYQAATVCALRAADEDDLPRGALVSGVASDWAQAQARAGDDVWGLANYELALALRRELFAEEPARYTREVTICLNNIASLQFRQGDLRGAERCFEEALAIRRDHPSPTHALVDLHVSLLNLGIVRVELGDYTSARELYGESLSVCAQRSDPGALIDLTRQEGYMSLCLARIPGADHEAREYAIRAAGHLEDLAPAAAAELRPLVDAAMTSVS